MGGSKTRPTRIGGVPDLLEPSWYEDRSAVRDLVEQTMALDGTSAACRDDPDLARLLVRLRRSLRLRVLLSYATTGGRSWPKFPGTLRTASSARIDRQSAVRLLLCRGQTREHRVDGAAVCISRRIFGRTVRACHLKVRVCLNLSLINILRLCVTWKITFSIRLRV